MVSFTNALVMFCSAVSQKNMKIYQDYISSLSSIPKSQMISQFCNYFMALNPSYEQQYAIQFEKEKQLCEQNGNNLISNMSSQKCDSSLTYLYQSALHYSQIGFDYKTIMTISLFDSIIFSQSIRSIPVNPFQRLSQKEFDSFVKNNVSNDLVKLYSTNPRCADQVYYIYRFCFLSLSIDSLLLLCIGFYFAPTETLSLFISSLLTLLKSNNNVNSLETNTLFPLSDNTKQFESIFFDSILSTIKANYMDKNKIDLKKMNDGNCFKILNINVSIPYWNSTSIMKLNMPLYFESKHLNYLTKVYSYLKFCVDTLQSVACPTPVLNVFMTNIIGFCNQFMNYLENVTITPYNMIHSDSSLYQSFYKLMYTEDRVIYYLYAKLHELDDECPSELLYEPIKIHLDLLKNYLVSDKDSCFYSLYINRSIYDITEGTLQEMLKPNESFQTIETLFKTPSNFYILLYTYMEITSLSYENAKYKIETLFDIKNTSKYTTSDVTLNNLSEYALLYLRMETAKINKSIDDHVNQWLNTFMEQYKDDEYCHHLTIFSDKFNIALKNYSTLSYIRTFISKLTDVPIRDAIIQIIDTALVFWNELYTNLSQSNVKDTTLNYCLRSYRHSHLIDYSMSIARNNSFTKQDYIDYLSSHKQIKEDFITDENTSSIYKTKLIKDLKFEI